MWGEKLVRYKTCCLSKKHCYPRVLYRSCLGDGVRGTQALSMNMHMWLVSERSCTAPMDWAGIIAAIHLSCSGMEM